MPTLTERINNFKKRLIPNGADTNLMKNELDLTYDFIRFVESMLAAGRLVEIDPARHVVMEFKRYDAMDVATWPPSPHRGHRYYFIRIRGRDGLDQAAWDGVNWLTHVYSPCAAVYEYCDFTALTKFPAIPAPEGK